MGLVVGVPVSCIIIGLDGGRGPRGVVAIVVVHYITEASTAPSSRTLAKLVNRLQLLQKAKLPTSSDILAAG